MSIKRIGYQLILILLLIFTYSVAAEKPLSSLETDTSPLHNIVDTNTLGGDYNEEELLESKTQESLLKITSPRARALSDEEIEKDVSGYTGKPLINFEPNDFPKRSESLFESLRNKVPHLRIGIGELHLANDQELNEPIEWFNLFDWQRVFLKGQAGAIFSSERELTNNNDEVTLRDPVSESLEQMNEFKKRIDDAVLLKRAKRSQDLGFLIQFLKDNREKVGTAKSIIIRNGRYDNTNQTMRVEENDSIVGQNTTAKSINDNLDDIQNDRRERRTRNYRSTRDRNSPSSRVHMGRRLKRSSCFCPDTNSPDDQLKAYLIQNLRLLPIGQGGQDMFAQFQQVYEELQAKAMNEYNAKSVKRRSAHGSDEKDPNHS